jgi:hypothetical protein
MRRHAGSLVLALSLALVLPAPAASQEPAAEEGPQCAKRAEFIFWTADTWRPLMNALAANPAVCADYYISLPPIAGNRTNLRMPSVYREVRDLGPQFHSLAEIALGLTGWAQWVAAGNGTWYDAGVEFRRRMVAAGLQPELGHTWLVNEFDRTTRIDQAVRDDGSPGFPRQAMRDLVRGLYEGEPGMPSAPGIVELGINQSHQNLPDVPAYKEEIKDFLLDDAFWADMEGKVRWFSHEVYADTRFHGVPGSTLEARRQHLTDYQEHLLTLSQAGGRKTKVADRYLNDAFTPFTNGGGYPALGGDTFAFERGHGNTEVPLDQMHRFVSEQVYSVRHFSEKRRGGAPSVRIGFSWQPVNNGLTGPEFNARVALQAAHIAAVLAAAYGPGTSAEGACLRDSGTDWCTMERPGAGFTEEWESFTSWK